MTHHDTYRGVPLDEIRIRSVRWPKNVVAYIQTRSKRRANDTDVEPEWATEAAISRGAEVSWAPPTARSGAVESESLLVLGYSKTVDAVLRVWMRPIDMEAGDWLGVNAAFAKARVAREHLERRGR